METDPKGQLGGLDTSEAVRKQLATQSRAWKCAGCGGRPNEEIIRECEEAAKAADAEAEGEGEGESSSSSRKAQEVEVPAELKLGFRDEMEKNAAAAAAAATAASNNNNNYNNDTGPAATAMDAESAELAEGFVQTVPREDLSAGAARPGQTAPQPTRTVPLPAPAQQAPLAQMQRRQTGGAGGVPRWIDRVIAALVVCLVGMILKVLLAK